jgi:hypothetical protein
MVGLNQLVMGSMSYQPKSRANQREREERERVFNE